jgi:hypothetical protein
VDVSDFLIEGFEGEELLFELVDDVDHRVGGEE